MISALGTVYGLECKSLTECDKEFYGYGGCCLETAQYWGPDDSDVTSLCRSGIEIEFYTLSIGWD